MLISENLAAFMNRYKEDHHLSIMEFSEELGIGKNTVVGCLKGTGNPQADTIELIAKKCGVPVAEIISAPLPGQEQAETIVQAAKLFSGLPPEVQERGIQLLLELAELFSKGDQS